MLEVFLQPLLQRVGDLVELVELAHPLHRRVVPAHKRPGGVMKRPDGSEIEAIKLYEDSYMKVRKRPDGS